MSTVTAPSRRATTDRSAVLAVVRLQGVKRFETYGSPLLVIAVAAVVSALVALVAWRASDGSTEVVTEVSNGTQFVLWWLLGYMGYNGVQSVATTFPLALSLGATRAAFAVGTLLHHVRLAAFVAVVVLPLLALERSTDGWFVGLPLLSVELLGDGAPVRLAVTVFLCVLTTLSLSGAFAAIWVRSGPRVTGTAGAALAVGIALVALVVVPVARPLLDAFQPWWLAVAAVVVTAVAAGVQVLALRRAAVR